MSDEPSEMIEALRRQTSAVITTAQDRREREYRGVSHLDRRAMRTPPDQVRNVQMNLKVSKRFKSRVEQYANAHKLSATEVLVRAFEALASRGKA